MTIGTKTSAFILCLGIVWSSGVSAEDGLQAVMSSLSSIRLSESRYSEEKHHEMLDAPMIQQGLLSYEAPSLLAWDRGNIGKTRYEIMDDQLIVSRGDKEVQRLSLDGLPALRAFVESFRATLAGDEARLRKYYTLVFTGEPEQWQMELRPREREMQRFIERIQIEGSHHLIRIIEIHELNGDWSRMELEPVRQEYHAG